MYTLINGSQKNISSNSQYFLNKISEVLDEYIIFDLKKDKYEDIIYNIKQSDTIVLAFPLYVDSPTSLTLNFLDYLYDNNISLNNKKLYTIINCGFIEGEQNTTAANIIKNFCTKKNIIYCGSILIGAGEIVGKTKYKLISTTALKKLNIFSNCIKNKEKCEDIITTINFINQKLYCKLANISWNKKAKYNKISKKDVIEG